MTYETMGTEPQYKNHGLKEYLPYFAYTSNNMYDIEAYKLCIIYRRI